MCDIPPELFSEAFNWPQRQEKFGFYFQYHCPWTCHAWFGYVFFICSHEHAMLSSFLICKLWPCVGHVVVGAVWTVCAPCRIGLHVLCYTCMLTRRLISCCHTFLCRLPNTLLALSALPPPRLPFILSRNAFDVRCQSMAAASSSWNCFSKIAITSYAYLCSWTTVKH